MTTTRSIENSDRWAAIRGLRMYSMDRSELSELIEANKGNPLFASKVITEAARQVLASKSRNA